MDPEALVLLATRLEPLAAGFAVVFLRVGAAVALMPGFGEQAVPMRIRLAAAVAFTLATTPLVLGDVAAAADRQSWLLLLTEPAIGLAIGFWIRLFVMALQTAGTIAGQAMSLSQAFGGATVPDPMPAFGNILVIGGIALAMAAGLHVKIVLALAASYSALPPGAFPDAAAFADWGVSGFAHAFAIGFTLAAPFVIVSVLYNLGLGAINKAMPLLMVALIGAPAITLGGILVLATAAPLLLGHWLALFDAGLSNPFGTP